MTFEEALEAVKDGHEVSRYVSKDWRYAFRNEILCRYHPNLGWLYGVTLCKFDLDATDWFVQIDRTSPTELEKRKRS